MIGTNEYVRIELEEDLETGNKFYSACLFSKPPEGGWPTGCDFFGHFRGVHSKGDECFWNRENHKFKFDDSVIFGVTADTLPVVVTLILRALEQRG